jgi:tetratricopeptide (TPR) repeat protein
MGKKSKRKKARPTAAEVVAEMRPLKPAAAPVHSVFSRWTSLHILLIILLSLLAYSNTFESSFHFDDDPAIVKNPIIKDLRYFAEPSSARDFRGNFEYKTFKRRYIGYLSFALNYRLHGLNVTGYHIVNLFIHICTSLLLYFFTMLTFKTPFLRSSKIREYKRGIALFIALLFACHPLQTQAVTYIWQRITSLSTLFYLLSLVAYIKWRLLSQSAEVRAQTAEIKEKKTSFPAPGRAMLYLLSLASAVLAIKTKEIAFMLPVMLTLYEFIFFRGKIQKRVLYLVPFLVTMLIIPLTLISIDKPVGELIGDIDETVKGHTPLSRGEYLLAEFRVLVTYLRLIFLPVNQNLDYHYPRFYSFFNIEVFLSFVFLSFILGLSVYLLFRYRETAPHTRIISFGIIWFFVNLLLESSIIPLHNVIYEHRMYLPSVGIFLALSIVIFMVIEKWKAYARLITVMLAVIITVLTGATYARNSVWKDELTLWQDVVNKSPNKVRGYNSLCVEYTSRNLLNKAIEQCLAAISYDPKYYMAYHNLGMAYHLLGSIDMAIKYYQIAIKLKTDVPETHDNLGNAYKSKGLIDKAIEEYQIALELEPRAVSHNDLCSAYIYKGLYRMAIEQCLTAVNLNPSDYMAYHNLGNAYEIQGLTDMAIEQYLMSIKLNPDNPKAHHNLGVAYKHKGLLNKAIGQYLLAIKFEPDYASAYHNLGVAYESQGKTELAIRAYNNALSLRPGWELPRKDLEEIRKER